jgi:hypothetical protein
MNEWMVLYPDQTGEYRQVGKFRSLKNARYFAATLADRKLPFPIVPNINDDKTPRIEKVNKSEAYIQG